MNASYATYLKSEHWRKLRKRKNKKRCAICGAIGPTDRHHLNYRGLFDVLKSDLRNICRTCHDIAHLLLKNGTIVYANESNQSRFSRTKAAVKRYRFGDPNISREQIAALA
jgi:hypothetical protein